ncbi:MAG: selenocysteine-specific translation elongation factor [Desulfobulbaceae bacterium]|nr:selenocysteine-specific translation elongation factor [Desulfobulbaceae bacterium]
MRAIILGTAGHVDHGKTSFIRALTGMDCDRLKEEKERGITIELGFASVDLPGGQRLGIVDVPGHEKFVRNMVAGAAGMDLVAFIVAADEGIMPQTEEHFEICRLLGVRDGIIVVTKKDLVEPDWLEMVEEELREFFADSFLAAAPVLTVDSISGEGMDAVRSALAAKVAALPRQDEFGPFRLPVDRVFSMKGFGTIITGTALSGRIETGADLTFYPGGLTAKIRGMQVHGQEEKLVEAGHRTAINLQGVEKEQINRGDMAASPGAMVASGIFDVELQVLASATKPLKHRSQVRVHVGTREITGRVSLLQADALAPGEQGYAQLILQHKAAAWPGDRFVVRSYSPAATIGGGRLLSIAPRKRKRLSEADCAKAAQALAVYAGEEQEAIVLQLLEESGLHGLDIVQLAARSGNYGKRLQRLLQHPISTGAVVVVDSDTQRMLAASVTRLVQERILAALAAFHRRNPLKNGMGREELRSQIRPAVDARLLMHQLSVLGKKGEVVQEGGEVRLSGHVVRLQVDEAAMEQKLEGIYLKAGLTPPNLKDALALFPDVPEKQSLQMLELLTARGVLVRVNDSLLFHRNVLDTMQEQLVAVLKEQGEIDTPAFKDLTGLTRKFSIPLLEYFDRIKLTLRIGDKRVLRKT